ncbi:MAG: branched-chain amino acid ABC transporter ATP-binding protein/permease [Armatimonadota bacterium]|nr:branched-chain amino acid ABC transporter ATP-binding protein/permease [Armatimonadota bacterium]
MTRRPKAAGAALVLLGAAVAFAFWAEEASPYRLQQARAILIFSVLALSWDVLARTGQLSLAHAAFYGLGGYTSALAVKLLTVPPLAGIALGAVVSVAVAVGLGLLMLRLHGIYFAIGTLAFTETLRIATNQLPFTGGATGLVTVPLFGGRIVPQYLFILAVLTAAVAASWVIQRSRWRYAFTAMRTNEGVARVMGVDVVRFKIAAFGISAFFAGAAGAYYAHAFLFISPLESYSLAVSVGALVAPIFGGLYSTAGPVLGAVLLRAAEEVLRESIQRGYLILYGLILALAILFMPGGLLGVWHQAAARARGPSPAGRAARADGPAAAPGGVAAPQPPTSAARSGGGSLLVVEGLTKRFGGLVAVSDLSFHVEEGEILGIIGPNGAGKTTVFNLISGLLAPDAGRVVFGGADITRARPEDRARLGIGRTFQLMQPFADMTVLDNVVVGELFGHATIKSVERARQDAVSICRLVGLEPLMHRSVAGLGVADLKRLELARALATHPRLLLADEVLAGLTPAEAQAVQTIRRVRQAGVTVLLIDHVMHSVRALCDRVIVMNFGRKLAEGPFQQVASDPRVLDAYLGSDDE